MEQEKNSFAGPSKTPSPSITEEEKDAWKLNDTSAYHASTDATPFSSSLPVLPHAKFNFDESELVGQSIDDDFPSLAKAHVEDKVKDLIEYIVPTAKGTFLPGNEDELFAGIMDDFDLSGLPTQLEDLDDNLFVSGGGLEIDSESHEQLVTAVSRLSTSVGISGNKISHYGLTNSVRTVGGEHPYGEHPSRTLFVRNINSNVEDSELRSLFQQYGDIRTLYTACKHLGFVVISYYDIRAAQTAMRALQSKPLRRRKLDIHFSNPKVNPSEEDVNQGTLVVFNLDASVSNDDLRQIFGAFGEVKEIRETPHKRRHKLIEFYDVRAADAALKALNRSDIAGKRIKLEPSQPGGARRSLTQQLNQDPEHDETKAFMHQVGTPLADSPPGSWPNYDSPVKRNSLHGYNQMAKLGSLSTVGSNHLTGLASILPSHPSNSMKIAPIGKNQAVNNTSNNYSISDSNLNSSPAPLSPFDYSKLSSFETLSGPQFLWGSRSIPSDGHQMDKKKQYQLDLEKIMSGEDNRTTLMIKNIPNKYTSKMLLAAIDGTHKGTYDFLYLPIDFKNERNVGYAFINMVSPSHIISFYEAFHGKKWEKFNSEKVASLAYARIQGKIALISHFQNSSLMNDDKRCGPIDFQSEGQGTGDLRGISKLPPSPQLSKLQSGPPLPYVEKIDAATDDHDRDNPEVLLPALVSSETSFLPFLRDICEASSRNESAEEYDNFLLKILEEIGPYNSELQYGIRADHMWILKTERIIGRNREQQMIFSQLLGSGNDEPIQFSTHAIFGECGIGKTALAKLVYEDKLVKENFELRVWVKVDGQELNLRRAAQQILKSTMGMSCSLDDLDELDEMVREILHSCKCLVVFDEVDSVENDSWIHIKQLWFDVVGLGSKILITTTSKDVADLVASQSFELLELSSFAGCTLCANHAIDSTHMKNFGAVMTKNLAALCFGNPLLLKLVGSLMRYDAKISNVLASLEFSGSIVLHSYDEAVVVLMCVWALAPQLRQCLAYCALYPKGFAMEKEKIIDMWIAHGLVVPSLGANSLQSVGDSYFHQLLCMSFFTDITCNQFGDITEFRLPGLIHKIMHRVAKLVWKGKVGVIGSISNDAGRVSLVPLFEGKLNPQMLILSPSSYFGGSPDHTLVEFKDLQSLDLSCSGIRSLPDELCALKELRYLNLSFTLIERLPESIMDLSHLQTLDLSSSYHFKILPMGISSLTNMSGLNLSLCDSLSYLPSGIGSLTSLVSMPLFVLGKNHNHASLGELRMLNHLRDRLEIRNLENAREVGEAHDAKLHEKNLQCLKLSWNRKSDSCFKLLELLQPNPQLKVLEITGYLGLMFPAWISSINSLMKISITDCGCQELPRLGQLPFLKELHLKGMLNIKTIDFVLYGDDLPVFPSLEQLSVCDMPRLVEWLGAGIFCILRTLTIEECPNLQTLPSPLSLPDLIVSDSNHQILPCLAAFTSLSSLLIKNMGLRLSFFGLNQLSSLRKLTLFNVRDIDSSYIYMREFPSLQHLGILHCDQIKDIILHDFSCLQKLQIVECRNLARVLFLPEVTTLMELLVDGCPKLHLSSISIHSLYFPRKLIIKRSDKFIVNADCLKELELEYLSISECSWLETQLAMQPLLISHIPCVILDNHGANYENSKDFKYDSSASFGMEQQDHQRKSISKGSRRQLSSVHEDSDIYIRKGSGRQLSSVDEDSDLYIRKLAAVDKDSMGGYMQPPLITPG